jgi:CRP-like cAMP-binding protein
MNRKLDKVWYLKQINLFSHMDEREIQALAERTTMREVSKGKVILRPDEQPGMVYLIKEGRVKISRYSKDGREQILALLEPGNLFGELGLAGEVESVHAEAFEDSLICTLRRNDFIELIRNQPELMLYLVKVLADRLRQTEEELADIVFRTVPARLASLLLRLAEMYGESNGRGMRLALRLTHHDIASMIGATRETVTSTLSQFRDDGLIDVDHRHIIIKDRAGLHRISRKEL